jgi:hypothetical protein
MSWELNLDIATGWICSTTSSVLTPEKWEEYVSSDLAYAPPCH